VSNIPRRRRIGRSSGSTGRIKPPRLRIWRRRGGTGRSRAWGSTGWSRDPSRRSTSSRGGTRRNDPSCPCRLTWRGRVGTEWSRTPRRWSTRRSTRSRSRHGPFAMALSPCHGVALSSSEHEKDEDLVVGCRCCPRSPGAATAARAVTTVATDTGRAVAPRIAVWKELL
jgi:hypothetical protein